MSDSRKDRSNNWWTLIWRRFFRKGNMLDPSRSRTSSTALQIVQESWPSWGSIINRECLKEQSYGNYLRTLNFVPHVIINFLRYFSGKQCKKNEFIYDVHYPDEKFCTIHWKTVDNLPVSSQEQSILTLFETVHVARLACSININEQNEEVISIIVRKDLGKTARISKVEILKSFVFNSF